MKKKEIIELHNVLKEAKLGGMKLESKMIVLNNLRQTTPIFNTYNEVLKEASERLKPEGFDDLIKKVQADNGKPQSECLSTPDEIRKANRMVSTYNNEMETYLREMNDEEVDFTPGRLPADDFGKFMETNDMEASKLILVPVEG